MHEIVSKVLSCLIIDRFRFLLGEYRESGFPAGERGQGYKKLSISIFTINFAGAIYKRDAHLFSQNCFTGIVDKILREIHFGDCFAYQVAKEYDCPLLYLGDDFSKTDIESAL